MKALVITDEILLADSLNALLRSKGFEVECVHNGEDAATFVETSIYDFLILDVTTQKMDGYEVARNVRANRCSTPILMLATKSKYEDEIEGMNAGADYYLTKPIDTRKLLAYINAILRRQGPQVKRFALGNTSLNPITRTLNCGSNRIRLSVKEFDVMCLLISSHGMRLPKEVVLCRVWGLDSDAVENNVEAYVGMLRKKLNQIGSNVRIEAKRRLGYIVEAVDE